MNTPVILIVLVVILVFLVFLLFHLFLQKDKLLLELKAKYDQLKKIEDSQTRIAQQKDDYSTMMVHELRSPLSIIRGSADLLKKESVRLSTEQKENLVNQIKDSSTNLLKIVNDILDVSKLESGRFEIKKSRGDINQVLLQCVKYYEPLTVEKEIIISTEFDNKIPEIMFDQDAVMHVMGNLLSNAVKFNNIKGSIIVKSIKKDSNFVQISVSDNGLGIPDEMKNRLFNKFVQVNNRNNSTQRGTGLGLAISKGIIESHGGAIWIENNIPSGAVFKFTIPV